MLELFIKHVLGEMQVIAHAPIAFCLAVLVSVFVIWRVLSWRYEGIIANIDADLKSAQATIATLKDQMPRGELAKEPLQFATEKDAVIVPISATRITAIFRAPMRVTPTLKFLEPDTKSDDLTHRVRLEYWSPMGFTVEFPPGTTFKQLRFTADARK